MLAVWGSCLRTYFGKYWSGYVPNRCPAPWHHRVTPKLFQLTPGCSAMLSLSSSSSCYFQCPRNSAAKSLGLCIETLGYYFGSANRKLRAKLLFVILISSLVRWRVWTTWLPCFLLWLTFDNSCFYFFAQAISTAWKFSAEECPSLFLLPLTFVSKNPAYPG